MNEAPAVSAPNRGAFEALDQTLRSAGPDALLEELVRRLSAGTDHRAWLNALLLQARHELELPLIQVGNFSDLPEVARRKYEERYIDAIRTVGRRLLNEGDVVSAWPYFRAIGEPEPVSDALERYSPSEDDERLGALVDVAFNQGANPRRGFELILRHYGTCSAITSFEHLPRVEDVRVACADQLVRQLHEHLVANLRAEIAHRGQPLPAEGTAIPDLLEGRDWLFVDEAYHIDVSHLSSAVRLAPMLREPESIRLAVELTEYGRRLSPRYFYEGDPPFERTFDDHRVYLRALLGHDVEATIEHFRSKIVADSSEARFEIDTIAAQVVVGLLVRLDRLDEAIEAAAEHLAGVPENSLACPSVFELCQRAGAPQSLARIAREQGDLVHYAAAILQFGPRP
jgi:hypothetical protein